MMTFSKRALCHGADRSHAFNTAWFQQQSPRIDAFQLLVRSDRWLHLHGGAFAFGVLLQFSVLSAVVLACLTSLFSQASLFSFTGRLILASSALRASSARFASAAKRKPSALRAPCFFSFTSFFSTASLFCLSSRFNWSQALLNELLLLAAKRSSSAFLASKRQLLSAASLRFKSSLSLSQPLLPRLYELSHELFQFYALLQDVFRSLCEPLPLFVAFSTRSASALRAASIRANSALRTSSALRASSAWRSSSAFLVSFYAFCLCLSHFFGFLSL